MKTFWWAGLATATVALIIAVLRMPQPQAPKVDIVSGVVEGVRVTVSTVAKTEEKASPAAGAAAGGLFFGVPGAIVGAALTGEDGKTVITGKVDACKFIVKLESGVRLSYEYIGGEYYPVDKLILSCSLLRNGDKASVAILTERSKDRPPIAYVYPRDLVRNGVGEKGLHKEFYGTVLN